MTREVQPNVQVAFNMRGARSTVCIGTRVLPRASFEVAVFPSSGELSLDMLAPFTYALTMNFRTAGLQWQKLM